MEKNEIIKKAADYAQRLLSSETSGHDWWHTYRVWKMSLHIARKERADLFVVQLAALLHDVDDYKLKFSKAGIKKKTVKQILSKIGTDDITAKKILHIIQNMSFNKSFDGKKVNTLEGKIAQDADRLDALGAVGIARTFAFGGSHGRKIYDPKIKLAKFKSSKECRHSESPSINHFYEKLLLIGNMLNTKTARQIAKERHKYLEQYLERFFAEWEGKR